MPSVQFTLFPPGELNLSRIALNFLSATWPRLFILFTRFVVPRPYGYEMPKIDMEGRTDTIPLVILPALLTLSAKLKMDDSIAVFSVNF